MVFNFLVDERNNLQSKKYSRTEYFSFFPFFFHFNYPEKSYDQKLGQLLNMEMS